MPKIVIGGNVPPEFKAKLAAKLAKDVISRIEADPNVAQAFKDAVASKYTTKSVPDTPLVRVYRGNEYLSEFTSLYAAKCYIEHREKTDRMPKCPRCSLPFKAWRHSRIDGEPICEYCFDHEVEEPPCDCYGCVTMRHPCVKEIR